MSGVESEEKSGLISDGGRENSTTGSVWTSALDVSGRTCISLFCFCIRRGSGLATSIFISSQVCDVPGCSSFRGSG